MKGLNEDQKDLLRDLMQSEGWDAVMRLCELSLERHKESLLSTDAAKPRALMIARARLDGAQSMVASLRAAKEIIKRDR